MSARYRAVITPWRLASATNVYGGTQGWITAVNTGGAITAGYSKAIEALDVYGPALRNVPSEHLRRLKSSYATVELADGVTLHGLEVVGRLRDHATEVEAAIDRLESDSLSSDPAMNTQIALLNKVSAANIIAVRAGQDANKLLVTLAEQEIIEAKQVRDAEARAFYQHIRFVSEGKRVASAQATGASAAMLAWRLP
jgi:hypothetical protein